MQSDLRRPERWRGRVRSPFAEWSVFVGAATAIVFGILFWTSIWLILRTPSRTEVSSEQAEMAALAESELDDADLVALDPSEDLDVPSRPTIAGLTAVDDADVVVVADASDEADDPEWQEVEGPVVESDAVAAGLVYGPAIPLDPLEDPSVAEGPVYGPAVPLDPLEDPALTVASANAPVDGFGAGTGAQVAARADEITGRVDEITARAEEIATKAEEFALRIEGLTARIEELETKLQESTTALGARPQAVPSTVALAARQSSQTTQTTVVRNTLALAPGGRAPWVVAPQPEPNSRVAAGLVVLEARARGEAPITSIRMQLDGAPVQVALDRRDEKTWRGRASVRVAAGTHTVAVSVVDGEGRTGSYRWQFVAR